MIIVSRGGSKAAGDTPEFLRIFASSDATACAAGDMFSAPGIRESTSASCAYALAAAVHLAGVAAQLLAGPRGRRGAAPPSRQSTPGEGAVAGAEARWAGVGLWLP